MGNAGAVLEINVRLVSLSADEKGERGRRLMALLRRGVIRHASREAEQLGEAVDFEVTGTR